MPSPLDIGPLLVAARVAQGMTQRELAERVGVKQPQIARWESSEYRVTSLDRVDTVARTLGVAIGTALPSLVAESPGRYGTAHPSESETGARALARLGVESETIAAFSRLHGVAEFALFGSSVRRDFGPDSDVDVLVTWADNASPRDSGTFADLLAELRGIFRRQVDLVDRETIEHSENYLRATRIIDGARSIYVAR